MFSILISVELRLIVCLCYDEATFLMIQSNCPVNNFDLSHSYQAV